MLVTLADQCDYKLMQYREEEKLESLFIFCLFIRTKFNFFLYFQSKVKQLKEEKKGLNDLVMQLNNEKYALQIQVDKVIFKIREKKKKKKS